MLMSSSALFFFFVFFLFLFIMVVIDIFTLAIEAPTGLQGPVQFKILNPSLTCVPSKVCKLLGYYSISTINA